MDRSGRRAVLAVYVNVAVHPMLCIQSQVGYNANTYALMQTWMDMGLDSNDVV